MGLIVNSKYFARLILLSAILPHDILSEIIKYLGDKIYSRAICNGILGQSYIKARSLTRDAFLHKLPDFAGQQVNYGGYSNWLYVKNINIGGYYRTVYLYINVNPRSKYFECIKVLYENKSCIFHAIDL